MNKDLIKSIGLFSIITGGVIGILTVIPFLSGFLMFILCTFLASIIMIYLKNKINLSTMTVQNGIATGAFIGFTSFYGFAITFIPLALLLNSIFKLQTYIWLNAFMHNFFFLSVMIFFVALLSALINGFFGFITIYAYQFFTQDNNK